MSSSLSYLKQRELLTLQRELREVSKCEILELARLLNYNPESAEAWEQFLVAEKKCLDIFNDLDKMGLVYVFNQEWADHQTAMRIVYALRSKVADGLIIVKGREEHSD